MGKAFNGFEKLSDYSPSIPLHKVFTVLCISITKKIIQNDY